MEVFLKFLLSSPLPLATIACGLLLVSAHFFDEYMGLKPRAATRKILVKTGIAVIITGLALIAWKGIGNWRVQQMAGDFGWWHIEANLPTESIQPGQLLSLTVRSDHDGYLWIFSPVDDLPNRLFPCSPSHVGCEDWIQQGKHRIYPDQWRPVPKAGTDPYGVTAGREAGPDELILVVTQANDPALALEYLATLRPKVALKGDTAPSGDWGAKILTVLVKGSGDDESTK